MEYSAFRAIAVLTPKAGKDVELAKFTRAALPRVRSVPGLIQVEASVSLDAPERLFLYYWWRSREASAAYMAGLVYAELGPALADLVDDHVLIVGELL